MSAARLCAPAWGCYSTIMTGIPVGEHAAFDIGIFDMMYIKYYTGEMANESGGAKMVKTVSTADARANLGDVLNGVYYTHEPVMVQKKGKTVAVIISPDEYEAFRRDRDARAWATVEAIGARQAGADPDAVLAEVTAIVEEVRRERYERRPR